MPVAIEDVGAWWVERGVGHVVKWTEGPHGFTATLCGTMIAGVAITCDRPERVCAECRRRLAGATPIPKAPEGSRPVGR